MKKQVILNQITLSADGSTNIQFMKQIVDDDGTILSSIPHRRVVSKGEDVQASLNEVTDHLVADGWPVPSIDGFDTNSISDVTAILK